MAKARIKKLKEEMLVVDNPSDVDVYPVTTTQAIYSQNPNGMMPPGVKHQKLEDRLQDNEADAMELHQKAESLKVILINDMAGSVIEITDSNISTAFNISMTGKAYFESYGDYPDELLNLNDPTIIERKSLTKSFTVTRDSSELEVENGVDGPDENFYYGTCDLSQGAAKKTIGSYTSAFIVGYSVGNKTVTKSDTKNTYIGLRMYAGFTKKESEVQDTIDTDINSWGELAPYLSRMDRNKVVYNNSAFTLTFPIVSGDVNPNTRYIHFAIPQPLSLTKITQPDGLGQELAFTDPHITVTRTVGGQDYTYNLYRTTLPQFSWRQLRLTLTLS